MIYCSQCHTKAGDPHFCGMVCQSVCEKCGRLCLGYVVEIETPDSYQNIKSIELLDDFNGEGS